jgi:hypothetical protein
LQWPIGNTAARCVDSNAIAFFAQSSRARHLGFNLAFMHDGILVYAKFFRPKKKVQLCMSCQNRAMVSNLEQNSLSATEGIERALGICS